MLKVDEHTMSYRRDYFGETVIVVFNNAAETRTVAVDTKTPVTGKLVAQFGSNFRMNDALRVELPAKSFEVFITSDK